MNLRKSILSAAAALLILAGAATTNVIAAPTDTGNATVTIASTGVLSVLVSDAAFGTHPYSFTNTVGVPGSLTVTATDERGTAAGWNVNLSGTDFSRDVNTSFDISNLNLTAGTVVGVPFGGATASASGITASSAAPVLETGTSVTKVLSAAVLSGAGQFDLPMTGSLTIPAGTLVGTYTSEVTVTIVSGP
jgi:hypothetical protein